MADKERAVAVVGSSPISLITAMMLAQKGSNVDLYEPRRTLGGAWRNIYSPILGQFVSAYNTILLPLSSKENEQIEDVIEFLSLFHIKTKKPRERVIAFSEYSLFTPFIIDVKPLFDAVLKMANISVIREVCSTVEIQSVNEIIVNGCKVYRDIFIPESMPIKQMKTKLDTHNVGHRVTVSRHIHAYLRITKYDQESGLCSYSEPFCKVFDRGSLVPKKDISGNILLYFKGRVSYPYKKCSLRELVQHADVLNGMDLIHLSQYAYISIRCSQDITRYFMNLSDLNSDGVWITKTGQLVESVLRLMQLKNSLALLYPGD